MFLRFFFNSVTCFLIILLLRLQMLFVGLFLEQIYLLLEHMFTEAQKDKSNLKYKGSI